jgi:hypothetical protein
MVLLGRALPLRAALATTKRLPLLAHGPSQVGLPAIKKSSSKFGAAAALVVAILMQAAVAAARLCNLLLALASLAQLKQ